MRRVTFDLLFLAVLAAVPCVILWSAEGLPTIVATRDPATAGAAGLMARESYAWLMAVIAVCAPLFVFVGGALLPRWLPRFGFGPSAGHWLAPERRAATPAALRHHAEGVAIIAAFLHRGAAWLDPGGEPDEPAALPRPDDRHRVRRLLPADRRRRHRLATAVPPGALSGFAPALAAKDGRSTPPTGAAFGRL